MGHGSHHSKHESKWDKVKNLGSSALHGAESFGSSVVNEVEHLGSSALEDAEEAGSFLTDEAKGAVEWAEDQLPSATGLFAETGMIVAGIIAVAVVALKVL